MKEPYEIYIEKHGKIKSGTPLQDHDYGEIGEDEGWDEKRKLAVSLAAEDAKNRLNMRTKSEFEEEINRLQG